MTRGGVCTSYLRASNALVAVIGLAVTGLAVFLRVDKDKVDIESYLGADKLKIGPLWSLFMIGCVIWLMALMGLCVARLEKGCMLYAYSVVQLLLGLLLVALGVSCIFFLGYQQDIYEANHDLAALAPGAFEVRHSLSDFNLGIYTRCCMSTNNLPEACSAGNDTICYFSKVHVTAGIVAAHPLANGGDARVCQSLKGYVGPAVCSGGAPNNTAIGSFNIGIYNYYHPYIFPIGISLIVLGSLLVFASTGSIYVGCTRRSSNRARQVKGGSSFV